MKYNLVILILILSCVSFKTLAMDSLRMETNNGKKFIVHRVEAKETLFAISQKYNVKLQELLNHNKGVENGLKIHQEILVPYFGEDEVQKAASEDGYVYHIVESGDTFYSISKKYEITADSLMSMNQLKSTAINLGDRLVVDKKDVTDNSLPSFIEEVIKEEELIDNTVIDIQQENSDQFHIVKASETLYSISKLYNVDFNEIKELNGLSSNELDIGQKLIISKNEQTEITEIIEDQIEPEIDVDVVEEQVKDSVEVVPETIKIDTLFVKTDNSRFKERIEKTGNLDKTVEEGFAMKIQNTEDSRKYLALHRNAPIGTVIEVKNQMNGLSIFARVVGKLPETGLNRNVLLRVSNAAFERLKALDAKIPVEIGFVQENE
ncbi:MAG: LysM repeat protein [Cyclobacteriaceae bacterium]|jgi:LysM repeat protein